MLHHSSGPIAIEFSMYQTAKLASLFLIVATLALGLGNLVSAQDRSGELQVTVDRLNQQLQLVARFDVRRSQIRYDALAQAIELWDASPRGDAEFAIMELWLQQALRASMPGSGTAMPTAPDFSAVELSSGSIESLPPLPADASNRDRDADSISGARPLVRPDANDSTPDRARGAREAIASKSPADSLATTPTNTATPRATASPWENHPATRPLRIESTDPFVDDPITEPVTRPSPATIAGVQPEPRVALRPTTFVSRETQPEVNIAELVARSSGYERGLQQINSKLIVDGEMNSTDLLLLTRELSELAKQHDFIVLYIDSLGAGQRDLILPPISVDEVKNRLADKIRSRQKSGSAPDDVFLPARDEALEAATELLDSI